MSRSRILYAAMYPGQRVPTLAGTYETAGDAWSDCLDQYRHRKETWNPLVTRAALLKAGYRVVKVRIVADE